MFIGESNAENALNFQHGGFDRTAQEYEQAARDEVHVAVHVPRVCPQWKCLQ